MRRAVISLLVIFIPLVFMATVVAADAAGEASEWLD
jgi:hypothetical protein